VKVPLFKEVENSKDMFTMKMRFTPTVTFATWQFSTISTTSYKEFSLFETDTFRIIFRKFGGLKLAPEAMSDEMRRTIV